MTIRSPVQRVRSLQSLADNLRGRLHIVTGQDREIVEAHAQAVEWAIANLTDLAAAEGRQMAEHRAWDAIVDRFAENWSNALMSYHAEGGRKRNMAAVACYGRAAVQCIGKPWPGAAGEVLDLIQRRTCVEAARHVIATRSAQQ